MTATNEMSEYQELLDQLARVKTEMNMLYDFYKDRRAQYDSLKSQLEEIIMKGSE